MFTVRSLPAWAGSGFRSMEATPILSSTPLHKENSCAAAVATPARKIGKLHFLLSQVISL